MTTSSILRLSLLTASGLSILLVVFKPDWLINNALDGLIGREYFLVLSVAVFASLNLLHRVDLGFGRLGLSREAIQNVRREIRSSVKWLVALYPLASAAVAIKVLVGVSGTALAAINAFCLMALLNYALTICDASLSLRDLRTARREIEGASPHS